jgi:hypothetical protein
MKFLFFSFLFSAAPLESSPSPTLPPPSPQFSYLLSAAPHTVCVRSVWCWCVFAPCGVDVCSRRVVLLIVLIMYMFSQCGALWFVCGAASLSRLLKQGSLTGGCRCRCLGDLATDPVAHAPHRSGPRPCQRQPASTQAPGPEGSEEARDKTEE